VEHVRSIRPSAILNIWLLISLVFDIARVRTLWLLPSYNVLAIVFTVGVAFKVIILGLEAREKQGILLNTHEKLSPELTSGFFSQSFFWWLNPLFSRGSKSNLTIDDLYPLDEKVLSSWNSNVLEQAWRTSKSHQRINTNSADNI
jgi:ATP-binding cassette subfamily C (CFTR/MRP) protein 1